MHRKCYFDYLKWLGDHRLRDFGSTNLKFRVIGIDSLLIFFIGKNIMSNTYPGRLKYVNLIERLIVSLRGC